jgi:vacuolar-type H+-ATPase subunit D/Vma8
MHDLLKNKHGQLQAYSTKLKEQLDESEEKIQHAQEKFIVANLRVKVLENDN